MQKKYNRILFTYVDAAYNLQFYIVTFKNWFIVLYLFEKIKYSDQFNFILKQLTTTYIHHSMYVTIYLLAIIQPFCQFWFLNLEGINFQPLCIFPQIPVHA